MSWRFIIAVLLIAAGASAWGGLRLGNWLIAHGPEKAILHNEPAMPKVPVLDANGHAYSAQPPQPLADGQLGYQQPIPPVDWHVQQADAATAQPNLNIAMATTTITMDQAKLIAAGGGSTQGANLSGIADVSGLVGGKPAKAPLQPVDVPPPPPPPDQMPTPNTNRNWQARFHKALEICSKQGFFDRPSCAWAARNQYCEPNHAWGKVRDCPAKKEF
ncbi:MAG TPA: hypothetical protein VFR20_00980 [Burkholderiaceae bacterium]|nr:hypothetical protein [Burkholderiaceae bacterium]